MAKSIRSKAKMAARRKKRESGNYHAADAARVARLSARLLGKKGKGKGKDEEGDEVMEEEPEAEAEAEVDATEKKISTSAPRGSRRDNWRNSQGIQGKRGKVSATGLGGGKRPFKPNRRR